MNDGIQAARRNHLACFPLLGVAKSHQGFPSKGHVYFGEVELRQLDPDSPNGFMRLSRCSAWPPPVAFCRQSRHRNCFMSYYSNQGPADGANRAK